MIRLVRALLTALLCAVLVLPASAARPASQPTEDQAGIAWFISASGETRGPYSIPDLIDMARAGSINTGTRVWTPGMADWRTLGSVPELRRVVDAMGRGPAPSEPEPLPPPREPVPPPLPPVSSGDEAFEWYYAIGRQTRGPYTEAEMCDLAGRDEIRANTLVYHPSYDWREARDVDALRACLGTLPPLPPPPG